MQVKFIVPVALGNENSLETDCHVRNVTQDTWLGKSQCQIPPLSVEKDFTFNYKCNSSLTLSVSRNGASITSLDNLGLQGEAMDPLSAFLALTDRISVPHNETRELVSLPMLCKGMPLSLLLWG